MSGEFEALPFGGPECEAIAPLLLRAAVESLSSAELASLGDHVARCERCRREAMETGDFVASLRQIDHAIGGPSRRFSERVRARIAVERALQQPPQKGKAAQPAALRKVALPAAELTRRVAREAPGGRPPSSKVGKTVSRARRVALWLAAALLVSLGLNFWWVSRSITGPAGVAGSGGELATAKDPRNGGGASAAEMAAIGVSPRQLSDRLVRLRAAQEKSGFVANDPTATAWWLVAESRAKLAGVPIKALGLDAVGRAQDALMGAPFESPRARAIAALGLAESAERLGAAGGNGIRAAVARLLGTSDGSQPPGTALASLAEARSAAIAKLASLESAPAPSPRFDGNDRARFQVDSRATEPNFVSVRHGGVSLRPLAGGGGALAAMLPEGLEGGFSPIPGAVAAPSAVGVESLHPGSPRTEALWAAFAATILSGAR